MVSVGDREADIYELSHRTVSDPETLKLLVRAEHNRLLAVGQGQLYEYLCRREVSGIQIVKFPASRTVRRGKRSWKQGLPK